MALEANERAILITEDDRVIRGSIFALADDRERLISITTRDFLTGLEAAGRINSADAVYKLAEGAGRNASKSSALAEQDEAARRTVAALLRGRTTD